MALPIEDYALIGDLRTAALVGRNGSIDWLCLPRFDSPACLAALLGTEEHGHWQLCPEGVYTSERRYLGNSGVLETTFTTATGVVTLDRPDAARRRPRRRRPPGPGAQRHRHDDPRVADPARLRRDPAVGASGDDLR